MSNRFPSSQFVHCRPWFLILFDWQSEIEPRMKTYALNILLSVLVRRMTMVFRLFLCVSRRETRWLTNHIRISGLFHVAQDVARIDDEHVSLARERTNWQKDQIKQARWTRKKGGRRRHMQCQSDPRVPISIRDTAHRIWKGNAQSVESSSGWILRV